MPLRALGKSAVSLSSLEEGEAEKVERASFSLVFVTPKSWLKNERWRQMLALSSFHSASKSSFIDFFQAEVSEQASRLYNLLFH